jgi:hypothetical protein
MDKCHVTKVASHGDCRISRLGWAAELCTGATPLCVCHRSHQHRFRTFTRTERTPESKGGSSYFRKARRDRCMRCTASWCNCDSTFRVGALLHLLPAALMLCLVCDCHSQRTSELSMSSFSLAPSPASLRIYPGISGATTITVINNGGTSNKVEFAATSPLPIGVYTLLTPVSMARAG